MVRSVAAFLAVLIIVIACPLTVCADDDADDNPFADALRTDRPDVAETAYTVGKLRFQLEQSFEYMHESEAGVTTHEYYFPSLIRFGIIDPLEFRVESSIYTFKSQTGQNLQQGFSDVSFGLKGHILDAGPVGIPALGLLASVLVPTGADEVSANATIPTFKLLMDFEFTKHLEVGTNLGCDVVINDAQGDTYANFLYAVAFNYTVHRTQGRWRLFIEASGEEPFESGKDGEHTLNTGSAFLITPNIQLDAFIRVGLTAASPDVMAGVGWAFRI